MHVRPSGGCYAGPLVLWRTDGLLIAFPVIAYGFTAHQFLFNIYATLRVPSVKRMVGVVQHVRRCWSLLPAYRAQSTACLLALLFPASFPQGR